MRIRVTALGNLNDEIKKDLIKSAEDLRKALMQNSPVDVGTFEGAWTLDPVTITIENNMDYAEALAEGHSPQAPDGWIETEIDNWRR